MVKVFVAVDGLVFGSVEVGEDVGGFDQKLIVSHVRNVVEGGLFRDATFGVNSLAIRSLVTLP